MRLLHSLHTPDFLTGSIKQSESGVCRSFAMTGAAADKEGCRKAGPGTVFQRLIYWAGLSAPLPV